MKLLIIQSSPTTSSLLGPNILFSILFSNTFSLCSSLSVGDQVSHPFETKCKIMALYILIFKCLEKRQEGKILQFCHIFEGFISDQ